MRVYFKTFGCRVNQYETEGLREKLLGDGVTTAVKDYKSADLCLVNTCTVTREADKDALQLVRRIAKRNPAARLVVTGCLSTRSPEEIRAAAPHALVVSNDEKKNIPSLLGCSAAPEDVGIRGFAGHSRAFVKVQDGCDMRCTYCIIPSVRPQLSSRPAASVVAEVNGLVERGYAEVVLCGVRLGRYLVKDDKGRRVDFIGLLERLLALDGDFRIRLSSLEITDITERFLDLFEKNVGKLCPSLHLPLQSGSEAVLKRMERWYSAGFYKKRIQALRRRGLDIGLFADILVGFPGETELEFETGLEFVREMDYSGLHVFRYSARSGTPAAERQDFVADAEIIRRAERMRAFDRGVRCDFSRKSINSRRRILVEKKGRRLEGLTDHFLRVSLDRDPGPGLHWTRIVSSDGPAAEAKIEL
ncbi:MAG: tRNA (N(6)-L-threonylcarbamoyladenosine(37)-C(2))-methylthiotransferase MtaB [Elusimicrobiota bacterium]